MAMQYEVPEQIVLTFRGKNGSAPAVPEYTVYPAKYSPEAIRAVMEQGIRYFLKAATSHDNEGDPRALFDKVEARLEAPEFKVRERGDTAVEELSLEDRAMVMALEPRFIKAGVVVKRSSKKTGAVRKTVLDVVDELGGEGDGAWEKAARAVGERYLRHQETDLALIPTKLDNSWKAIQEDYKENLKALRRQEKAASKADF